MSSELFFLRPAIFNVYLALPLLGLLSQFKPDLSLAHYCIVLLYYKTSKAVVVTSFLHLLPVHLFPEFHLAYQKRWPSLRGEK